MRDAVVEARANEISVTKVIMDQYDLRQIALNRLFGITHRTRLVPGPRGLKRVTQGEPLPGAVPAFSGLREAYTAFTGDTDFTCVGKYRVAQMGVPDFASALANTLNNLLLKDYAADYRWQEIVSEFTSLENFRPQQRARARYVADLPDVGEDAPYDEIQSSGDEGYTIAANTKGGTLTLTRRMVMADNVDLLKRLLEQLGRAAMRTLAKRVWAKVINNDTYGVDATAMFHTNHANLGDAALSVTSLTAARAAMFAQQEPGSDERLGLGGGPFLLAVPLELESTARTINSCDWVPGTTDGSANPWYHRFGPDGENIFVNPLFTDVNNWCLFDISGKAGILEVGYLQGQQNPQIILANDPAKDGTFSQDRITYRIRHEYEVAVADYRASYKAVVS